MFAPASGVVNVGVYMYTLLLQQESIIELRSTSQVDTGTERKPVYNLLNIHILLSCC